MADTSQAPAQGGSLRPSPSTKKTETKAGDKHKAKLIAAGADKHSGWHEVEEAHEKAATIIGNLDASLNNVLRKQEYEYLQAYNIYVKRKEKELHDLIFALHEKNKGSSFKETRISNLELTVKQLREKANEDEKEMETMKKDTKVWKEKLKVETEEKDFYHKQALDAKRKNKLLKVAIGRLQMEKEKTVLPALKNSQIDEKDTDTFLTGANVGEPQYDCLENSQALVEQNIQEAMEVRTKQRKPKSTQHQRTRSQGGPFLEQSRYRNIPTENLKFQQFIDLIFESKMPKEDVKFEILNYVQALETNYTDALKEEKIRGERLRKELRKEKSKHVNDVLDKGDLENLFVDCVEDVRRNVIKRRLKAEIVGKKKIGKFDEHSEEAKEFEDSLLKLANLAKDRVKFSEFTTQDRNNLLDLFVNNEQTLLKIYEVLFPRKQDPNNSLRQLNSLKNSSDTIRFGMAKGGQQSDFLKGDSLHQRSLDETQAATELAGNSTMLPSIMPAMNSIQSNDIMTSLRGGRSTNIDPHGSPGHALRGSTNRFSGAAQDYSGGGGYQDNTPLQKIGHLNQRSHQNVKNGHSSVSAI